MKKKNLDEMNQFYEKDQKKKQTINQLEKEQQNLRFITSQKINQKKMELERLTSYIPIRARESQDVRQEIEQLNVNIKSKIPPKEVREERRKIESLEDKRRTQLKEMEQLQLLKTKALEEENKNKSTLTQQQQFLEQKRIDELQLQNNQFQEEYQQVKKKQQLEQEKEEFQRRIDYQRQIQGKQDEYSQLNKNQQEQYNLEKKLEEEKWKEQLRIINEKNQDAIKELKLIQEAQIKEALGKKGGFEFNIPNEEDIEELDRRFQKRPRVRTGEPNKKEGLEFKNKPEPIWNINKPQPTWNEGPLPNWDIRLKNYTKALNKKNNRYIGLDLASRLTEDSITTWRRANPDRNPSREEIKNLKKNILKEIEKQLD
jgi:hypothetical protein